MAPAMALSSTLAPLLRTYCARNADGASRNAIDSVGHASMPKIACTPKKKKSGHVAAPTTMRKQHHEASASASTRSSRTSVCVRQTVRTGCVMGREHVHSVREMTCMPAALFPSAPL